MKLFYSKRRNHALTLVEVMIVVVVLGILMAMLLPILAAAKRRSPKINCVSNLKQVNLAFRIWEGDHNNQYPMAISVTNGGAMESVVTGDVLTCFRAMSNELSTPMILCCPEDSARTPIRDFGPGLTRSNISYFVAVDAEEAYPQRLMSGDDNFVAGGIPVKSGLFTFATNAPIAWGTDRHDEVTRIPYLRIPLRHNYVGNLGFADGSVGMFDTSELQRTLIETALATNHFAIP